MNEVQVAALLKCLLKLDEQLRILDKQREEAQKLIKYCQEAYPTNSDPGKKSQNNK